MQATRQAPNQGQSTARMLGGVALRVALALMVLGLSSGPARGEPRVSDLWAQVEAARGDSGEAEAAYRSEVRWLFSDLVAWASRGAVPQGAAGRAQALGYTLTSDGELLLVAPAGTTPKANGICAIRLGGGVPPLVLQAPHAWSDLHTGRIAARLFEEGLGRAVCFNTEKRGAGAESAGVDLAHTPNTAFQAATQGMIDALADPLVVQLHGFGARHGSFGAVVSGGAALQPAAVVEHAVARLDPLFEPWGPVVDGAFVPALAGERNVQGRICDGAARFLHLELNLATREHLRDEEAVRTGFREALTAIAEEPR